MRTSRRAVVAAGAVPTVPACTIGITGGASGAKY
jgi:hypothetical protein